MNTSTQPSETTPAASTLSPPDMTSIMEQIAKLEQNNKSLQNELSTKSDEVSKLSEKKRQEMKVIYDTMMSKWIDSLDTPKPEAKDQVKNGLLGVADKVQDENGIWQVLMCASANAAKMEEQYQSLQTQYDDLKQKADGGQFANEDERVGGKRSALGPPEEEAMEGKQDIWSQFETYMKSEFKPEYIR
jgi:chromosome segregation ATPase